MRTHTSEGGEASGVLFLEKKYQKYFPISFLGIIKNKWQSCKHCKKLKNSVLFIF